MCLFGCIIFDERKDLTAKDSDTSLLRRSCPDEQTRRLRMMFESVEDMLESPDYDKDLKSELSDALPNFDNDLKSAKRDLLRNDCGIVVTGETSSGKTTLINQLLKKHIFVTKKMVATTKIVRIRNSETMKIKYYSKDEKLMREEDVQDEKQLKSTIKRFTQITDDYKEIHYVDVYLPVPILKGNVIIIDTPGIGEAEMTNNMLLEFLPNAVAFVFVVNANNAGGIHKDGLLKILETVKNNLDKMPCFDPRDALFLTTQWDAIDNDEASSDEDEDQHTEIWNFIQTELCKILNTSTNIFRTSLKQVKNKEETFFTDEYKRFETELMKTIETNKNKRVEFYYGFLKNFIRNAERGTLARLKLLETSESENFKSIVQSNAKIQDLEQKCKKSKKELDSYKTRVILNLAEKLYFYLHSKDGMQRILNPFGKHEIGKFSWSNLEQEVASRIEYGIQRWCQEKEVKSIIEDADKQIRSRVNEVESKLKEIEIEMTGINLCDPNTIFSDRTIVGFMMLPLVILSAMVLSVVVFPFIFVKEWYVGADGRRQKANAIYYDHLRKIPLPRLKESFKNSFGIQYSKVIDGIFDKSLPEIIKSLRKTNKKLGDEYKSIKQKRDSFLRLREKIMKIQQATENFEMNC